MTTRELMSAASVLMLLAGVPAIAHANDHDATTTIEAPADETAKPTDETTTDEATTEEGTADHAPADERTETAEDATAD